MLSAVAAYSVLESADWTLSPVAASRVPSPDRPLPGLPIHTHLEWDWEGRWCRVRTLFSIIREWRLAMVIDVCVCCTYCTYIYIYILQSIRQLVISMIPWSHEMIVFPCWSVVRQLIVHRYVFLLLFFIRFTFASQCTDRRSDALFRQHSSSPCTVEYY